VKLTLGAFRVAALAVPLFVASLASAQTPATSVFKVVPTPNQNFNSGLFAASASSPTDIWAVGQSAIHYDGVNWTAFPVPSIHGDNTSSLSGVVTISPTLAWVGGTVSGGSGTSHQVIEQWNGTKWSMFPGPRFLKGDQPSIFAMTATSADDIWAIGSLLPADQQHLYYLFEHWNGQKWTATRSVSDDAFLMGASADATNDVWAVGFNGPENDNSKTLAMHFDGLRWKQASTPSVGAGANQFNAVQALAPDDVWAVGFSTPVAPPTQAPTLTLIEHFDGKKWSVVPSPNVGPHSVYQSNRLFGLTANTPTDIWAFGSVFAADGSGNQLTLLLHWDGLNWKVAPSPNPTKGGFLSDLLFAGVTVAPGNIWIFGAEDEAPHGGTLAIHTTTGASF